jgi:hypothetical protein
MSSAIEVLKSEKVLYIEKIKEIESRFNGMPFDIKESYQKSVKVYQEFIDALDEAIVALEWKSNIEKEFVALGINTKKIEGKGIIHIASDYVNTERKLFDLKSWLEKEIRKCYPKNFCFKDWTPIMDTVQKQVRHDTLKEVLERVGEQK